MRIYKVYLYCLRTVVFYFIILWFSLGQLSSQTNDKFYFVKIIQNRDKKVIA